MNSKTTVPISQARNDIFKIANAVQAAGTYYTLTEHGRPKVVMLSAEEFESIMETMEMLSNPEIVRDLERAEKDFKQGKYTDWEEVKKNLDFIDNPAFMVSEKAKRKYGRRKG